MIDTHFFDVTCPATGETVRVGLNAAELFSPDNIEAFDPETQLWWSNVVRQYQLDRAANPTDDPEELFETTLRAWPDVHPVPQA